MDIESKVAIFINEALKLHLVQCWAESYGSNASAFSYHITQDNEVFFLREQARQLWSFYKNGMDQWISVFKELPNDKEKVLVYRPDAHLSPACDENIKICEYRVRDDNFLESCHEVTHWKRIRDIDE